MNRLRKSLSFAIIATEASHIFCCVLPTLFSLLTLAAGLGLVAAVPAGMTAFHEKMHDWEVPVILLSGAFVMLGWGVHYMAKRVDCHNSGCAHGPCGPVKTKSGNILKIATLLFVCNVLIYLVFHQGLESIAHAFGAH